MEGHGWANRLFGTDRFYHLLLAWIGLLPLLLSIIPIESLLPILLYIGLLIGAQHSSILQLNTRRPLYLLWCRTLQRGLKIK